MTLTTRIEQAIARGLDDEQAARSVGCSLRHVRVARERLDALADAPDTLRPGERVIHSIHKQMAHVDNPDSYRASTA